MEGSSGVSLRLPTDQSDSRLIVRRSLHNHAINQLRDMIVEHDLAPGERIDETHLCRLFGISRTPLREALKVLASEGLVELRPHRGARVSQMTAAEVAELFEVVSGLERIAAELAAERASDAALRAMRRDHERMIRHYRKGQRSDYFRFNQKIHAGVIALTGNETLAATHAALMVKIRRARYTAIMSQDRWDESVREHGELLDALEARDGARAGEILFQHVRKTGEVVQRAARAVPDDRTAAAD